MFLSLGLSFNCCRMILGDELGREAAGFCEEGGVPFLDPLGVCGPTRGEADLPPALRVVMTTVDPPTSSSPSPLLLLITGAGMAALEVMLSSPELPPNLAVRADSSEEAIAARAKL